MVLGRLQRVWLNCRARCTPSMIFFSFWAESLLVCWLQTDMLTGGETGECIVGCSTTVEIRGNLYHTCGNDSFWVTVWSAVSLHYKGPRLPSLQQEILSPSLSLAISSGFILMKVCMSAWQDALSSLSRHVRVFVVVRLIVSLLRTMKIPRESRYILASRRPMRLQCYRGFGILLQRLLTSSINREEQGIGRCPLQSCSCLILTVLHDPISVSAAGF